MYSNVQVYKTTYCQSFTFFGVTCMPSLAACCGWASPPPPPAGTSCSPPGTNWCNVTRPVIGQNCGNQQEWTNHRPCYIADLQEPVLPLQCLQPPLTQLMSNLKLCTVGWEIVEKGENKRVITLRQLRSFLRVSKLHFSECRAFVNCEISMSFVFLSTSLSISLIIFNSSLISTRPSISLFFVLKLINNQQKHSQAQIFDQNPKQ